jgi:hypothetical protein
LHFSLQRCGKCRRGAADARIWMPLKRFDLCARETRHPAEAAQRAERSTKLTRVCR